MGAKRFGRACSNAARFVICSAMEVNALYMKRNILLSPLLILLVGLFGVLAAHGLAQAQGGGVLTFKEVVHDFGEVQQGGDGYWKFEFTNTGTAPVVVSQVKCGFYIPYDIPREPVLPGQDAFIGLRYDTNRIGGFDKVYFLQSDASEPVIRLSLKGTIVPKLK